VLTYIHAPSPFLYMVLLRGAPVTYLNGISMKPDLLIQMKSFWYTLLLFWSKRTAALMAFVVVFILVHLLPAKGWFTEKAHAMLMSYELSAPNVGWMLAVSIAGTFLLLVVRPLSERRPGSVWTWVADGFTLVTERALSRVAYLATALFGASAGFGSHGVEFGVLSLVWIYVCVSLLHALMMFADKPKR
jgi:hypothetical protein